MGRPGWYYDGHPPACTCVACNEGSMRSRAAYTASADGGSRWRGKTTGTTYNDDGGGSGIWKGILIAIIAVVAIAAIGGAMEEETPSPKPASSATSTAGPSKIKAADSDVSFIKSMHDFARDSGLAQPEVSIADLEAITHQLINTERRKQGLHALELDREIAAIARNHSVDMALRVYFSHTNTKGWDSTELPYTTGILSRK